MTIAAEGKSYTAALAQWASDNGGIAEIVPNLKELWRQAFMDFEKPRILFCFVGETMRSPFSRAAAVLRVDRQWQMAVTRGRGLAYVRGSTLTDTVVNATPFLTLVETARDKVRALITVSAEEPVDYKGMESLNMGNLAMDGYLVKWSTAHDLPALSQQSPNNQPI